MKIYTLPDVATVGLAAHIANVGNPHSVTKTQVGLSNVENTALTTWAGTSNVTTVGTLSSGNATAIVDAASTSAAGKIECSIASEVNTGSSTSLAITPDSLAGSNFGKRSVPFRIVHSMVLLEVGDSQLDFSIPPEFSGMNLVSLTMEVDTASSGAAPSFSIERVRTGTGAGTVDVLSVNATIDAAELTSLTATTAYTINAANDDVIANATTQDRYRFNCDVAGTNTKGWAGSLAFQLP